MRRLRPGKEHRMGRRFAAVLAVGIALAFAGSASAGPSQAGCQVYGAAVADAVQGNVPAGQVVSGIALGGPRSVSGFVAGFKAATCG
jgi:hypothetical protein